MAKPNMTTGLLIALPIGAVAYWLFARKAQASTKPAPTKPAPAAAQGMSSNYVPASSPAPSISLLQSPAAVLPPTPIAGSSPSAATNYVLMSSENPSPSSGPSLDTTSIPGLVLPSF